MAVVLLVDSGWPAERIPEASTSTSRACGSASSHISAPAWQVCIDPAYRGSEPALSNRQRAELETELDAHLYMMAKSVYDFVGRTFGVTYTPNAMTTLLKRLGYFYKKPKCVPVKADAVVQEAFANATLLPMCGWIRHRWIASRKQPRLGQRQHTSTGR